MGRRYSRKVLPWNHPLKGGAIIFGYQSSATTLRCEHAAGPDQSWTATVTFRHDADGATVWASNPYDPGKQSKVARLTKQDDWREAARWLRQWDGGLGGNLFDDITVSGAGSCAGDILAMCWVIHENPAEDILDFLLDRNDGELEYIYSAHNSLKSEKALLLIEDLQGALIELELEDLSFESAAREIGLDELPPVGDFIAKMRDVADEERTAVPEYDLAEFLADQPEGVLSTKTMGSCASRFPSPSPGPELERLLESWLAVETKPGHTVNGFTLIGVPNKMGFLHWLLSSGKESVSFAQEVSPKAFGEILTRARGVELRQLGPGMGGAQGHFVYRNARDRWEEFLGRLGLKQED